MTINWYPGHMHKARKEIRKVLGDMDVVIEILDARIPFSSANPVIRQLQRDKQKPGIKILNKADLADPVMTTQWQEHFERENHTRSLAISANADCRRKTLLSLCRKLVSEQRKPDKAINAMILGIPNVGKSTLINALAGKSVAKVGNEPAVTKRQQKIRLADDIVLHDTPGILWPKLEPATCGYRLAAIGSIRDTAMDYETVALFTLEFLRNHYPEQLASRYRLSELPDDNLALLEQIGTKRGCLRSGNIIDHYQAATIVLQELRSGKLGSITLESPEMMASELEILRQEIAERKAAQEQKDADEAP